MTTTVKIAGMNCEHCAQKVKTALEGIQGVTAAKVSVEDQSAVVELTAEVAEAEFSAAVEASGYNFAGVE